MAWFQKAKLLRWKYIGICLLLLSGGVCSADTTLRLGVYDNPPFSYGALNGKPDGFVVQLISTIAREEGWDLQLVTCSWNSCNQLLALGEIDMLSPISTSEANQRRLDYNRESLYVNWGQIVMHGRDEIKTPLDLEGKTVVAISSDTHFADLKELAERFDIQVRFLEVDDYEAVLAWVDQGPVDAGLVSRSVSTGNMGPNLIKSSVIFNPAEIRIAFSPLRGQLANARLAQRIDYHMTRLKGDRKSAYYQLQRQWFGHTDQFQLPQWLIWLLIFAGLLLLFLAVGVVLLRRQVRIQTANLREINDRFAAFMGNLPGIAYMKNTDGRYVFVNNEWQRLNVLNEGQVAGKLPAEIWPERKLQPLSYDEQQVLEQGKAVESEEQYPWSDPPSDWRLIRFPIYGTDGGVIMVGGIGIDVTKQKDVEKRLSAMHHQQQLVLESAGDGIIGLNGSGRCTFVNQAALDILGYQRDDILGSKFHDLVMHSYATGETYPERKSPAYHAYRMGQRFPSEQAVFWGEQGTSVEVEFSAYPIADSGLPGAVLIFRVREALSPA